MTEREFDRAMSNLYTDAMDIKNSNVAIERVKEIHTDVLNIKAKDLTIQVIFCEIDNGKSLHIVVNNITVCYVHDSDMTLNGFYKTIEETLLSLSFDLSIID